MATIFLPLMAVGASTLAAAQTASLHGRALDSSNKPLVGAKVTLQNPSLGLRRVAVADADGSYSFGELPAGPGYKLTVTLNGRIVEFKRGIAVRASVKNAAVYGTVYDPEAKPLPGAVVKLENPTSGFARSTTTIVDGTFSFAEVPPAPGYKITAMADGRVVDVRDDLTVSAGEESAVFPALKLKGYRPLGLDEVEDALAGDIPKTRLISLVEKYGVEFGLDNKIEARLRKLGADDRVIIAILKNKK